MIKKIAIASVLFLSFIATAQAASFNVSLDGFCNTFTMTTTALNSLELVRAVAIQSSTGAPMFT